MAVWLLQSPSGASLDLTDWSHTGLIVVSKTLGSPDVREVSNAQPQRDGVDDDTLFLGQRVINISGEAVGVGAASRSAAWNRMQPFLDPKVRSTLTYQYDSDVNQRVLTGLRAAQWEKHADSPNSFAFQVQWRADPVALDQSTTSVDLAPLGAQAGRVYSRTYNLFYGTSGTGSAVDVNAAGNYTTWPIYDIYGPCTNPTASILNTATRATVAQFRMLYTIPAGSYIEVNTANQTVYLNASPGASRFANVDFANTWWAPMQPGPNTFYYTADSWAPPTHCTFSWRNAYLP